MELLADRAIGVSPVRPDKFDCSPTALAQNDFVDARLRADATNPTWFPEVLLKAGEFSPKQAVLKVSSGETR